MRVSALMMAKDPVTGKTQIVIKVKVEHSSLSARASL